MSKHSAIHLACAASALALAAGLASVATAGESAGVEPGACTDGSISLTKERFVTTEGPGAVAVVKVQRSGATGACGRSASVRLVSEDGAAVDGIDYVGRDKKLVWASGENSIKRIRFQVIDDDQFQGAGYFNITLYTLRGAVAGPIMAGDVLIYDDETPG